MRTDSRSRFTLEKKNNKKDDRQKRSKVRTALAGIVLMAGVAGVGYLFASDRPLNQGLIFFLIIVGLVISDSSFWPNRPR